MNIFVITACYKFREKIDKYVESFNNAFNNSDIRDKDINFRFLFVNDDPGTDLSLKKSVSKLVSSKKVKYSIHSNKENMGVTYSRNWAAIRIFELFSPSLTKKDRIIYFDCDDIWDKDAINILYSLRDNKSDFVFLPVEVTGQKSIPINPDCVGEMELGKFCTYLPMQECIYCWSVEYAYKFIKVYGFLWYQDNSNCKYYPEDMMFHLNPKHKCEIIPGSIICHRSYDEGNIALDWYHTILNNKPAFRKLVEMHRVNMHRYEYPPKTIEYINWVSSLVYEDSDNK